MRANRRWAGWVVVALTLAPGCGRPHKPVIQTMAGCGHVMQIIEVDGHLYGWTKLLFDPEARIQGCAFDVDARGELPRVDRYEAPGFTDMIVERDGAQIFAMWMPGEPFFVRLFRRGPDGMRELAELRADGLQLGARSAVELLPTARGPAVVAHTYGWSASEELVGQCDWCLQAWRPLDTTADPLDLPVPANAYLLHDAGTIVAITVDDEDHTGRPFRRQSGSSFTVSVLDELAEGDDAIRWTRRVPAQNHADEGSRLVDVASTGERVFILAWEEATEVFWLACLAAADGELLWTAPVEVGELPSRPGFRAQKFEPWGLAGMRTQNDGVVIAMYGRGRKWTTVVAVGVSAANQQSILGKREVELPQVYLVEPAADGHVWLAGSDDDDTWLARVELRPR